jgi:hypothetical protein
METIKQKYPGITQEDVDAMLAAEQEPPMLPTVCFVQKAETVEQRLAKLETQVAAHEKQLKVKQTNARKRSSTKKT